MLLSGQDVSGRLSLLQAGRHVPRGHMQVEEVEEVTAFVCSGSRSARQASKLQCLDDIPWICRATAMWPDNCYLASDGGTLNTADNFPIAAAVQESQIGTRQTYRRHQSMSALSGEANISACPLNVRSRPKSDIRTSAVFSRRKGIQSLFQTISPGTKPGTERSRRRGQGVRRVG